MTTIVKAANAAQFLGSLPSMLDYTPAESVVLVPFAGRHTCGALRFDLPEAGHEVETTAATMIGTLCRLPQATSVAIVVYSASSTDDDPPRRDVADALRVRADACGLGVHDALFVGTDGWGSYLETGPRRPLSEICPPTGFDPPSGDQSAGATLPTADPSRRALLERLLPAIAGNPEACDRETEPLAVTALTTMTDLVSFFERVATAEDPLSDTDAAALVTALTVPAVRDIALIQWASDVAGGQRALDEAERWRREGEYSPAVGATVWGEGPQPSAERLRRCLAHCRQLVADAPDAHRGHLLTACGWLAWALGSSSHAAAYAQEALRLDQDLVIAQLVSHFTNRGQLPAWAFEAPGATSPAGRGSSRGSRAR